MGVYRWTGGSGYLIRGRLVLTAAHNVDYQQDLGDEGPLLVRTRAGSEFAARVVLVCAGAPEVDLALLEISDPRFDEELPPITFAQVDRNSPEPVPGCWAVGFPRFGEAGPVLPEGSSRDTWEVCGNILPGSKLRAGLLSLQVTSTPQPQPASLAGSEWEGMSGAVVFATDASGGKQAVGVVSTHHRPEGESALTVVPITGVAGLPTAKEWWHRLGVANPDALPVQPQLSVADQQRSRLAGELALKEHWDPRGRGVEHHVRPGWFFTGRRQALSQLVAWLTAAPTPADNVRVVTGGPGSGKSAVLARLVTMSNPGYRTGMPGPLATDDPVAGLPPGAIDVAVHARTAPADEVVSALAAAAGATQADLDGLIERLLERPEAFTIAVDALDEADNPPQLALTLRRLAGETADAGVRLLVGTRPGGPDRRLITALGLSTRDDDPALIDLDTPAYLSRDDLAEYVRRRLLLTDVPPTPGRPDTPYRGRETLADQVAAAVARAAYPTFLIGQLVSRALLLRNQPISPHDPGWQQFPKTVADAMDQYLASIGSQAEQDRVEDLLRPLAYARGDGLPLDDAGLWPRLATALARPGRSYTAVDVASLLDTAADYLIETVITGQAAYYRLYHQALSDRLQERDQQHPRPVSTAQTIYQCLLGTVARRPDGARDWPSAHPYLHSQLAGHAAEGAVLDFLLEDAGFLAVAEPARLLAALPAATTGRGRQIARAVARVGQQLLQAMPGEQACYLEMAARMTGDECLARDVAAAVPQRPWSVPWARWQVLDDGQLLGQHDDDVEAVSAVDTAAGTVVVSASASAIRACRLADGSPVAPGIRVPASQITGMAAFSEAGEVVVLTGHEDGQLLRTTLGAAAPPRALARDRAARQGLWLISHAGQPAVVTATRDGDVEVLSVTDGHPVGLPPLSIADGEILAAGNAGQRCLLAMTFGGRRSDSEVLTWDLDAGMVLGSPLRPAQQFPDPDYPDRDSPVSVDASITECDGHPVLLAGISVATSAYGGLVVPWDPVEGRLAGKLRNSPGATVCVLHAWSGDGNLWCWGDVHGNLYLARDDDAAVEHIAAHDHGILAMTAYDLPDGPVIITGGGDGAVRAWRPGTGRSAPPASSYGGLVITQSAADGRTLITSITEDGTSPVLDAADGQIVAELRPSTSARHRHIALLPGPAPAVVTLDTQNQVAVWRPPDSQPLLTCQLATDTKPIAITVTGGSQPMLLAAMRDGRLAFFDLVTGHPASDELICHTAMFTVAADPAPPSGTLRFLTATSRAPSQARLWTVTGDDVTHRDLPVEPDPDLGGPAIYGLSFGYLQGRRVAAAAGAPASLHIWDASDGSLLAHARFTQGRNMSSLNDVDTTMSAGKTLILAGGYTCSLVLWAFGTQEEHYLRVGSPLWRIKSLPEGQVVVAGLHGIMAFQLSP